MTDIPTHSQVSAGGVVFRANDNQVQVVLISVGEEQRWQLPKGLVGARESVEETALREVREETGLQTELIAPLDTIEYWYYASRGGKRLRYHKFVHYFLLRYQAGDTADHDAEVNEARWFEINEALAQLTYKNERDVLRLAQEQLSRL